LITIKNRLRATNMVEQDVEMLVFIRFEEVRLYELSPLPVPTFIRTGNPSAPILTSKVVLNFTKTQLRDMRVQKIIKSGNVAGLEIPQNDGLEGVDLENLDFVQESEDPPLLVEEPHDVDMEVNPVIPVTADETNPQSEQPMVLDIGRHYEYTINNVLEMIGRYYEIPPDDMSYNEPGTPSAFLKILVRPHNTMRYWYSAWSGHLSYRIFVKSTSLPTVRLFRGQGTFSSLVAMSKDYISTTATAGTSVSGSVLYRSVTPSMVPTEVMTHIGNTVDGSHYFIDLSIPFNTNLTMLKTTNSESNGLPSHHSQLLVAFGSKTLPEFKIFERRGDDFRYHCYTGGLAYAIPALFPQEPPSDTEIVDYKT